MALTIHWASAKAAENITGRMLLFTKLWTSKDIIRLAITAKVLKMQEKISFKLAMLLSKLIHKTSLEESRCYWGFETWMNLTDFCVSSKRSVVALATRLWNATRQHHWSCFWLVFLTKFILKCRWQPCQSFEIRFNNACDKCSTATVSTRKGGTTFT